VLDRPDRLKVFERHHHDAPIEVGAPCNFRPK
jgi:hypothetical protein